ncbi:sigma-54-dependent transcriptional regulator [Pleomorphovibrio marinus]|uniref:sigma-54-dependent transcriptional regulator n=1 Tax=Pleomorphovibrio marinus TaxID=2164132 RepID=UPI000E0A0FC7|nr:sigma-54 dependent transcriptional regulator [Pleomorphovibrio marinus]
MNKVLLIEDDLTYSKIIRNFLEKNGYKVEVCTGVEAGIGLYARIVPDLVITDYRLPDGTGMQVLEHIISSEHPSPVILITNYSDIRTAVKSMKMGASEYITKPVNPDELLLAVQEGLKKNTKNQVKRANKSPNPPKETGQPTYLVGKSSGAEKLERYIDLVAPTDMSVIVLGESGTGKEYISKRIHQKSKRKDGPFIAVDCGALSKELAGSELFGHVKGAFTGAIDHKTGHFQSANGGTIFLDEIGNLSYEVQIKLLRAIQERKIRKMGGNKDISVDVRIVSATNDDLMLCANKGDFREDLFHRLNEFTIHVSPLRERKDDLFYFADLFLKQSNEQLGKKVTGLSEDVQQIFRVYSWPGNLRELKNVIKRAVLITGEGEIFREVIPMEIIQKPKIDHVEASEEVSSAIDLKTSFEEQEKQLIIKTLHEVRYNKSKAAKMLNMDRKTLYNKLDKYNLE